MGRIIVKIIPVVCVFALNLYQFTFAQCIPSPISVTTINNTTAVLNSYYPGESSVTAGSTSIIVGAKRGTASDIADGDLLLIIQIQGVEINTTIPDNQIDVAGTNGDYGDGDGGLDRAGFLSSGNNIAGQYEYIIAGGAVSGGILPTRTPLSNSYLHDLSPGATQGTQTFQVVRVANYQDLTITATGSITGLPWNGRSGGIVAIDVNGTLNIDGAIQVDGQGFRGGGRDASESVSGRPGHRGEGIAGTPRLVYDGTQLLNNLSNQNTSAYTGAYSGVSTYPGGNSGNYASDRGMGAPGNAGGAGFSDGGGAGGANGGNGGIGSINSSSNTGLISVGAQNLNALGGDRLYLGGGGGSGGREDDGNDNDQASSGQPGGGIILLRATQVSGGGILSANGLGGFNQSFEGGGGGGAGGTILINTETANLSGLTMNANGGSGNNVTQSQDGGGGGGGGGSVLLNRIGGSFTVLPVISASGGNAGTSGSNTTAAGGGNGGIMLSSLPGTSFICNLSALPITLVSFEANVYQENKVRLLWTTAQEIDNAYFSIERSLDGIHFEEILRVEGAGTSSGLLQYAAIDPLPKQGLNYYRLRQTDFDGTFTTSDTRVVALEDVQEQVRVFPNPTQDRVNIQGNSPILTLHLRNLHHEILSTYTATGEDNEAELSLKALPKGMYLLEIVYPQKRGIKKIIKH